MIVVTGGTKGIGKAIIEKFSEKGFDIITCSRNSKDLEGLKKSVESTFKNKLLYKVADLSKKSDVESFSKFIKSNCKNVEVLVNNTGFFIPGQVCNEEEGALEKMMNTNLYSAYHLTRRLVGDMIQKKHGHIFNICSTASIMAYSNGGSYGITKWAMYGMSKVLREELKEHGIRVTSVLPGATLTASWEGVDLPSERFMKSSDVAEMVLAAYQLSRNSVVEDILIRPQLGDI